VCGGMASTRDSRQQVLTLIEVSECRKFGEAPRANVGAFAFYSYIFKDLL